MPNTWLFQGNPDLFDIDGYLAAGLPRITWVVRQRAADLAEGDRVYLWRAQGKAKAVAGVIAAATVASPVWEGPDHEEAMPFWRSSDGRAVEKRVWLEVDRVARSKEVLKRDWLAEDPVCNDLLVITQRTGTNWLLPDAHRRRLDRLWERTGVDWSREDCVAALWAYDQTYGGAISKKAGEPVSVVAAQIGRVVTSVYLKLVNFRTLDPRDSREGFGSGSQVDREVWSEFFDPVANDLRHQALEREYLELWGAPVGETPPTGGARPAPPEAHPGPTPVPPPPPGGPLVRGSATVSRIVRDTNQSRWVKLAHGYTCQICGVRLVSPAGSPYAEGAHIQPLGAEHGGPDRVENLLCLCPNHHVLLDIGALAIGPDLVVIDVAACGASGRIRTAAGHSIGLEYLAYQRTKIALLPS